MKQIVIGKIDAKGVVTFEKETYESEASAMKELATRKNGTYLLQTVIVIK